MKHNVHTMTDNEKARLIRSEIMAASDDIRQQFPVLKHQDTIGALIMASSVGVMVFTAVAYYYSLVNIWAVVLINAVMTSLLHELEHDLIHLMYFKHNKFAYNLMMTVVWLARPTTISPWKRRELHLLHHKVSGSEEDIEERAITNGEKWGVRRILMMLDGMYSIALRRPTESNVGLAGELLKGSFPVTAIFYTLWHGFLAFTVINLVAASMGFTFNWPAELVAFMDGLEFWVVVLFVPNVLRSFCLNFVSSNMHYFGDVERGNLMQQTQVLNPWWMIPFQVFCFNFGSTHAIHHFVVRDPFYIRQMTAPRAHEVMKEYGIRFNDTGTFARANRFHKAEESMPALASI